MTNPAIDNDNESQSEIEYPDWAICPLTLEVMKDPLMDKNGLTYEREAIVEWLRRGNSTCPLTRKTLSYSMLVPNAALRLKIEQWKRVNNIPVEPLNKPAKDLSFVMESDAYYGYSAKSHMALARFLAAEAAAREAGVGSTSASGERSGLLQLQQQQQQETPEERRGSLLNILDGVLDVVQESED